MLCEGCDKAYHPGCLRPQVTTIPKIGWKCKVINLINSVKLTYFTFKASQFYLRRGWLVSIVLDKPVGYTMCRKSCLIHLGVQ